MVDPKTQKHGYKKEKFRLKHLLRKRLNVHAKYLTANPVDVLEIAKMFPVKDQGQSGSCGGQAWAYYIQTLKYLRDGTVTELSAHDIYSHSWTPPEGSDEGHLIEFVENNGVDLEADVTSYENGQPPSETFMENVLPRTDAALEQIVFHPFTFQGDINSIKQAIDLGNGCVTAVWGNNVAWQTSNGIVGIPSTQDWGHWVYAVAYNDQTQLVTILNSWGKEAGDNGFYYLPYAYFENNCMGGWIFSLEPKGYVVGLLTQIANLLQNIISKLSGK